MSKQPEKQHLPAAFGKAHSGAATQVALSALSAWLIVCGLKGLLGFAVNRQSALADLAGIVIVIGLLRWSRARRGRR